MEDRASTAPTVQWRGPAAEAAPIVRRQHQLALYVHIPYCQRKCPYCDFNSYAVEAVPEEEYLRALFSELDAYRKMEGWARRVVSSIYFGGGTASLLEPATLAALLAHVKESFGTSTGLEVTLEANPAAAGELDYAALARAGINRLSLGVQSFDDRALKTLGRLHGSAESRACVRAAAQAGFTNIALDLIFGVPGASLKQWRSDLDQCLELEPSHISTYELTIEPGTRFYRLNELGLLPARREEDLADMYTMAREVLQAHGYRHYEISNFARPGKEARHNRAYWCRLPYLGLGAGAHSFDPECGWGARWSNLEDPAAYMAMALKQGTARASREELSKAEAMDEFVFLGLRQLEGVSLAEFEEIFSEPLWARFPQAETLLADGLIVAGDQRIALSERGLLLADAVIGKLLSVD